MNTKKDDDTILNYLSCGMTVAVLLCVVLIFVAGSMWLIGSYLLKEQVYAQEVSIEICENLIDDDGDAFADMEDPEGCSTPSTSSLGENCDNFVELSCTPSDEGGAVSVDVGNVATDHPVPVETDMTSQAEICGNAIDDDEDGLIDADDLEGCITTPEGGADTDICMLTADDNDATPDSASGMMCCPDGSEGTSCPKTTDEKILDKLVILAEAAKSEGNVNFGDAVIEFRNIFERELQAATPSRPIPPSPLSITYEALKLWLEDTGNQWGTSDATADLDPTAECYGTVAGDDSKCNIYVAEVIYRATGITHQAHQEAGGTGKYFPYRAAEWADTSKYIPNFRVDNADPKMGDIWAAITDANIIFRDVAHTGIYLGEYNGIKLYISARSNGDGVYGLNSVQYENGIQIKQLVDPGERPPKGGVFRELDLALAPPTPPATPSDIGTGCVGMKC